MSRKWWWTLMFVVAINPFTRAEDAGEEGFVDSQGVRIHYVTVGKGPLVVLNLPHPKGMLRELAHNPQQQKNSQYARDFQKPDAAAKLKPEFLAFWVTEPEARKKYVEAFRRSSIEGILNYYKANYPKESDKEDRDFPPVKCPVLII